MYKWYGCINHSNSVEFQSVIDKVLRGEAAVEKLRGSQGIFKTRINKVKRLLWATIEVNGLPYMLILPTKDDLIRHKYDRFSFREKTVLKRYFAKMMLQLEVSHHLEPNSLMRLDDDAFVGDVVLADTMLENLPWEEELEHYHEEAFYDHQRFVLLSHDQRRLDSLGAPLVLSGAFGSGKTVAFKNALLSSVTRLRMCDESKDVLCIAESASLIRVLENTWGAEAEALSPRVIFKTYDELLATQNPEKYVATSKVGREFFYTWFKSLHKRGDLSVLLDKQETVYQEFRTISAYVESDFFNLTDYKGLGERHTLFYGKPELQDSLVGLYQSYIQFLDDSSRWDPAFAKLEIRGQYATIFADEAGDFSKRQLLDLCMAAENYQIYYAIDAQQMLHDWLSNRHWLDDALWRLTGQAPQKLELLTHYRSSNAAVSLINALFDEKRALTGGASDKYESVLDISSDPEREQGRVFLCTPGGAEDEQLRVLLQQNDCVVITLPEYLEQARQIYSTSLVYTAEQYKGQQARHVIIYQMLDNFKEENKLLRERKLPEKASRHRGLRGQMQGQWGPAFHQLCNGIARATHNVYVVNRKTRNNDCLYDLIQHHAIRYDVTESFIEAESAERRHTRLLEQTIRHLEQGEVEQAQRIFIQELHQTFDSFKTFAATYGVSLSSFATEQTSLSSHIFFQPAAAAKSVAFFNFSTPRETHGSQVLLLLKRLERDKHPMLVEWFSHQPAIAFLSENIEFRGNSESLFKHFLQHKKFRKIFFEVLSGPSGRMIASVINEHINDFVPYLAQTDDREFLVLLNSHGICLKKANAHGQKPIYIALMKGHQAFVDLLISYGVKEDDFFQKTTHPFYHIEPHFSEDTSLFAALVVAVKKGDIQGFLNLMNDASSLSNASLAGLLVGAELHANKLSLLALAVQCGHLRMVEYIAAVYISDVNERLQGGVTVLLLAVQFNYPEIVRALLDIGANPNITTDEGYSPFLCACHRGYASILNMLYSGLDLRFQYQGESYIDLLMKGDQSDLVMRYYHMQNLIKEFVEESRDGHILKDPTIFSDTINMWWQRCLNIKNAALACIKQGDKDISFMEFILEDPYLADLFKIFLNGWLSAHSSRSNMVKHITNMLHFCRLDDGKNILHMVALHGRHELFQLFDASPFSSKYYKQKDKNGNTPLHFAVLGGEYIDGVFAPSSSRLTLDQRITIEFLANRYVDACQITNNDGISPLKIAIRKNEIVVVMIMVSAYLERQKNRGIEAVIDSNVVVDAVVFDRWPLVYAFIDRKCFAINTHFQTEGCTLLHLAVSQGNLSAVKKLVGMGAMINLENDANKTPLAIAQEKNFPDISDFLQEVSSGLRVVL